MKGEKGVYTVKRGDTLWEIAKSFGTTVSKLKRLNNFRGRNPKVYPGDRIKVNSSGKSQSKETVYVVKKGDSLWAIAKMFNTTVSKIRRWNNLPLRKLIIPGDRLKIFLSLYLQEKP